MSRTKRARCVGTVCNFGLGDGTGGNEEQVGDATTSAECVALVQSTRPQANGATYPTVVGTACYAEFGMTGAHDSDGWQTCQFDEGQGGTRLLASLHGYLLLRFWAPCFLASLLPCLLA